MRPPSQQATVTIVILAQETSVIVRTFADPVRVELLLVCEPSERFLDFERGNRKVYDDGTSSDAMPKGRETTPDERD